MLFNSIDFALFLPLVFLVYWLVLGQYFKAQNLWLFVASYFFYGWWDERFLSLIFFSTVVDFWVGRRLGTTTAPNQRRALLWVSVVVNLGLLGFFKYYNFFLEHFVAAFSFFGAPIQASTLEIILPVGISFYTFQTLSYTIEVYQRKLEPTKDFIAFGAFVSFFPQLVAGPIERATHLLPQFYTKRHFEYNKAVDGLRQMLWGLFKKVVIADNCAEFANLIFNHSNDHSGSTLALGALFFTFQIYGDFSGYSDMAIGTARLFGFDLKQNFNFPYFSRDMAEFWRRWHISLSTWFRDYLYIPLGGSRGSKAMRIRNTFIIFVVSGFWHGANWTFIVWGALNAVYFLPLLLTDKNRQHLGVVAEGRLWPNWRELLAMLTTFGWTVLAWVFFRADNLEHALAYLSEVFSPSFFTMPGFLGHVEALLTLMLVGFMIVIEWLGRTEAHALAALGQTWWWPFRYALYYGLILALFLFGGQPQEFIYFQF